MGILDKIGGFLSGGLGAKIADIVGQHIGDKAAAEKAVLDIQAAVGEREHEIEMALIAREAAIAADQSKTNQVEAASDDRFKGRWRPLVGYISAFALGYEFLLRPMLAWVSGIAEWPVPPPLEMQDLIAILTGILGLGTLRTTEKKSGVA